MMTGGVYDTARPDRIVFGQSVIAALAAETERLDKDRVAIFCSASLEQSTGLIAQIKDALGHRFAGAFTDIPAHTPRNSILEGTRFARNANADMLVAIGGGSVIDGVKAIQLAVGEGVQTENDLTAYARGPNQLRPLKYAKPSTIRQIAVPTTLSGAEFSAVGGVTDTALNTKEGYACPNGMPMTVIYDPRLCLFTPQRLWLSSAIRSVDHACEGFCSPDTFAYLDQQFLSALRLLATALPASKADPGDVAARSLAQQGVWTVSAGIGKVTNGASHGLGYILGALGVPHGETSCVMLPAVLEWNAAINRERQSDLAEALGRKGLSSAEAVRQFVADLGMPTRLADVGIHRDTFDMIADKAIKHPTVLGNPRPIESREDILQILSLAS